MAAGTAIIAGRPSSLGRPGRRGHAPVVPLGVVLNVLGRRVVRRLLEIRRGGRSAEAKGRQGSGAVSTTGPGLRGRQVDPGSDGLPIAAREAPRARQQELSAAAQIDGAVCAPCESASWSDKAGGKGEDSHGGGRLRRLLSAAADEPRLGVEARLGLGRHGVGRALGGRDVADRGRVGPARLERGQGGAGQGGGRRRGRRGAPGELPGGGRAKHGCGERGGEWPGATSWRTATGGGGVRPGRETCARGATVVRLMGGLSLVGRARVRRWADGAEAGRRRSP